MVLDYMHAVSIVCFDIGNYTVYAVYDYIMHLLLAYAMQITIASSLSNIVTVYMYNIAISISCVYFHLRQWLKATITLVIVMGLTWIMGIAVFDAALIPVAYIFTIFVAFQV